MFKPINGFTKAKIIEAIQTKMQDHRSFGKTAEAPDGQCLYKAEDGNRCAVGCFIPDGHDGENSTTHVTGLLVEYPDLKDKMPLELNALSQLQRIHDGKEEGDPRPSLIKWVQDNVQE